MTELGQKRCALGIWDSSVPGIDFDNEGVSNYAHIQKKLMNDYPKGEEGIQTWLTIVEKIKKKSSGKKYNCLIGISGGVDSSYLLYLAKEKYRLNPLAVNLDNGWNSEVAVNNIKKVTKTLNIDLITYVIDYEEIKDLLRSHIRACLPWVDGPTDDAIKAVMYKIALKEDIKYIFRGNDFRCEGKQPREWTYSDNRQLNYIHRKYGEIGRLKTYPELTMALILYAGFIHGIKEIRPYYYLDYNKSQAKEFLEKEFGWRYYGGHHHENLFTKFVMSYWLPEKFHIDKRKINLSAQVLSGYITKKEALEKISKPALNQEELLDIRRYVLKKLDLSDSDFDLIMSSPNKTYKDYPNNENIMFFALKFLKPLISLIYEQKPMAFTEMEINGRR